MEQALTDKTKRDDEQKATHAHPQKKRKWTAGETIFNFGVYGGISWIVNEILSTIITNTIYRTEAPISKGVAALKQNPAAVKAALNTPKSVAASSLIKEGAFYRPFESVVNALHKRLNPMKWSKTPFYLAAEMFVMCLGGTILVVPTKWIEDRKGKIVRGLDKVFHGGKQDPKLEEAHQEMDHEPKQSWGSLWKGRLLVLVSAITLHFVAGAEKTTGEHRYVAPTTKWLQGTFMEKYSNLSRVMKTGTRDLFSLKWMPFISAEHKAAMREARMLPGVPAMTAAEGKIAFAMGNTFGYVLSVSAAMATLFFISSKIFAARRDQKKGHQQPADTSIQTAAATSESDKDEVPKREERSEAPRSQVMKVENMAMLQSNTNALAAR